MRRPAARAVPDRTGARAATIDYATLRDALPRASPRLLDARAASHPARPCRSCSTTACSAATVFLGAMYGGYVVSPVNLLAQDAQLEYTLGAFGHARSCSRRRESRSGSSAIARVRGAHVRSLRRRRRPARIARARTRHGVDADPARRDPAMLMYTSGTTGTAEGRAAVARQPAGRPAAPSPARTRSRPTIACCRRCRSITSTASASPRSRRSCPAAASSCRTGSACRNGGRSSSAIGRRGSTWCRRSSRTC